MVVGKTVQIGRVELIEHFLDLVLRHIAKAQQRTVEMNIAGQRIKGIKHISGFRGDGVKLFVIRAGHIVLHRAGALRGERPSRDRRGAFCSVRSWGTGRSRLGCIMAGAAAFGTAGRCCHRCDIIGIKPKQKSENNFSSLPIAAQKSFSLYAGCPPADKKMPAMHNQTVSGIAGTKYKNNNVCQCKLLCRTHKSITRI